ncbi:hypothetical protein H2514_11855 [Lysobacter sp. CW239]|uniref:hypothetical protein n=1 Tax=Lysobacteraceae TaxID=32033 RepID=UPI0012EBDD2D|nr:MULTISPECIES: hypothetical protein [Lysobacter]QOD90853.1 hypothetical protein H2514_11855 [Lysobacter sp. CW239]
MKNIETARSAKARFGEIDALNGYRSSARSARCAVRPGAAHRAFAQARGSAAQTACAHPYPTRRRGHPCPLYATPIQDTASASGFHEARENKAAELV